MDRKAWIFGAWGFGLAALTLLGTAPIWGNGLFAFFMQLPNLALGGMSTLVHEGGHALFGWLAGRASIPAFDLRYGGGVTLIPDTQHTGIFIVVYLLLAASIFHFRRNLLTVAILIGFGLLHAGYAFSGVDEPVILLMGHGTELLFAVLALYRALSGECVAHEGERLAYSLVGWFLTLHNLLFGWGLMTSVQARYWYGQAKGGGHWMDFDRIAREFLHMPLSLVAAGYVLACLSAPVAAFVLYRYRNMWRAVLDRLADPEPGEG